MRVIISLLLVTAACCVLRPIGAAATPSEPAPTPAATDSANQDIPPLVQGYMQAGADRYESGDYHGAIEQFSLAIEADPTFTDAYRNRGAARDAIGDYKDAVDDFTRGLSQSPNDAPALEARGQDRYRLGDYAGADADLTAYLKHNPNDVEVVRGRAYARAKEGDAAGAVADYRRAVKLDPNDLDTRTSLAGAEMESHDFKGAAADLDAAIHLNPKSTGLINMRMQLRMIMGNMSGALDDAQRLIKLGNGDAKTYDLVCSMEFETRQYEQALTTCTQEVKRHPDDVDAYRVLEHSNRMLQRDSAVLDDLSAIIRLQPQSGEGYYERAIFEEDHGDRKSAASDYRLALKYYKLAGDTPHVQQIQNLLEQGGY